MWVFLQGGVGLESTVSGLRIRLYNLVEYVDGSPTYVFLQMAACMEGNMQ